MPLLPLQMLHEKDVRYSMLLLLLLVFCAAWLQYEMFLMLLLLLGLEADECL
jgi:diacylglycerol kinase